MKFPVDLLADVSLAELERSAHNYMNNLLYSNPDSPEHLTTSASTKVIIDISSVGFIPLYGSDDTWKILALFSPSDPFIAVGLYLLDRWWAVEDILKTADPARDGVLEVETVGDRIVLYILNRVIYRGKEMTSDELPFLCHGKKDYAKIVWNNGEAVGFYSVKPSGTICNSFSVRTYQLSVMDSIFVRKCQRRKGFGLQMLVDFVLSFKEESLGLRYPVTKSMYKVCEKYLCQYPGDADLLWEVESIGGPKQRTNIARKIMAIDISVSKSLSFSEESLLTPDVAEKVLKETTAVECSVETMEEVTVLRATKEIDDVPVVSQRRSSHTKQRITGEKMKEDKSEKTIRIEEIEAETPRKERVSVQRKTELHDSQELEQTEVSLSVFKEKAGDVVDTVPEGGPTMRSNKPATVLTSGDLAEDHVTSATMTEEQHVEDDATQDLINKSHDSQITVENVASETQEAEVCEKEEEADIPFGEDAEENILPVELDEEMSRKDEETPANEEQVQGGYEEGKTVIESRVLRSGKKTVRATARIKTTKRQDGEQEEEADGVNTKGDKPAEDGVLREGRRSAATTRQQSKQAQEETTVSEEIQVDKTKAVLEEAEEIKETRDRKNEDNNEEEAAAWKNENPEPEVEIEQVEVVEGVSLREQDTAEEEPSTASVTCADREEVASIQECAEETPDEGKVPSEEDAVADETTTVHQAADEAEEESTAAKEIHIAETKDSITEEIEEKDGEDDASQKDDTEDTLNTNVENISDEIEALAVESRVLRGGGKLVTTTPVSKTTTRGHKQSAQVEMLVEKSADTDEMAVETRILRKGRRSAPATSRRKSKRARIQCQPEEQSDEETVSAEEMEGEEGEVGQESPEKTGEKAEEGGKIMEMEIKPSNDAEQGEAESAPGEVEDSILPKSAPDSTVFSLSEEEAAPSAEEQQNEEMVCPISGLQGLNVVLVDMKENVEVHKETAATEEAVPVEKIADEAEEEQSEETMKQEKTMPEEQFHDASMEIEKTEIVEEEGLEEKVEDAVIMEDTGEGSAEETGGENNTKSDDEQNSTVNETGTPRGRKKQITAPTGHESVRVLRSGRKSVLVIQTCTRKSTHKQIQKEESEEGEESPAAEGSDPEEEEEEEAELTSVIDQEKGEIIENDASQQEESPAAEMDIENMNTVAEETVTQDVPVVGKADSTETITDEDAEALVGKADEGMTSDVVEKEAATGPETVEAEESTSEVEETAAGENSENKLLTSNDDHKEETPVIESRVLKSGKKIVRATTRIKTTKRQDDEQEEEADGVNTKGDKPAEDGVVREGRRSAATTRQQMEETTVTEEIQVDKTKAVLEEAEEIKETRDRKNDDNNEEEAAVQKHENPEPEVEIEQVEALEGVSLREQDTAEEEQSTASVTCADREEVASIQECAEETPDEGKVPSEEDAVADETTVHQAADEAEEESTAAKEIHIAETKDSITEEIEEKDGEDDASQKDDTEDTLNTNVENVSDEIEAPAVESRVLRGGGKLVTTTPVSKTTKRGHKQSAQVEMLVEKSADTDELAVETRILRKGRRSAPATSRRKSKRARIQCQPEEQSDEETVSAQEMEGEEGEVGQESPEKTGEKAEEGGKIMEMEIKPSNDAEQRESAPGGEYVVADTEQMKDSMIEETAVIEGDRGDNSKTDLVETDIIQISSAEVEETNSVGEEGITNIEKSTPVTEVVSDTAIAEEEAEDECAHEVAEEDAPAATTMSLRSKTNTSHPRLTRRSRGQKTQEPVETKPQQMEEENLEDVETQEVPPMTDNSPEQREQKEEQTEAEEMSATGHEAGEDIAEYIDKETSDSRVVESLGDDTQSVDKEVEEKVESDEDKDNMTDDFSDNQHIKKLKDGSEEENLENAVKAGQMGSILNSTLDIDEEVETQSVTQKQENDEQNMSEEEMESILIGKRVLRSRIVPSVIITPQSKSRRRSTKVQIAEESSSDEETSPQSSKRRSLRKRKSTDVTPAHKFKRSSRVQEVLQ
ncbi:retinitis pigmentosa 1-like 1 protein [Amphiprion ocellaris]|uniref:N-acetyltransferase domain-containing protein n=1 Tax=Amphiprion ocellaris TaxID=80972 RepID=A0AAQ5Y945_AMPOC|nr:retinitis pigmentosa 1-like 1 protein [Amphiprion ocellaris]XP_054867300.1 retinitis pigmentosa 1-like 1 protein [Amphiprion ocellaris]XP_054867301.1 retinitis pigmentosa 1-like 1 protein [Amphiprion ocellaris]